MSTEKKRSTSKNVTSIRAETLRDIPRPSEYSSNHTDAQAFAMRNTDYGLPKLNRPFLMILSMGLYLEEAGYCNDHFELQNFTILFTLSGEGQLQFRERTTTLRRGDVVYINNFEPSRLSTDRDRWEFCFFNITGACCQRYDEIWNNGGLEVIHIKNPEQYDVYRRQANQMLSNHYKQRELHIHFLLTTIFHELFMEKNRSPVTRREERPAWIEDATTYIAAHYNENLSIAAIAKQFSFSTDYFSRLFRQYTRHTPKEYQILCRVDEAAVLLSRTELPIADIALRTGFTSPGHFTQSFRRIYDKSPSEYRKKSAEK